MLARPELNSTTIARPAGIRTVRSVGHAHLVGICGSGMKALAELLTGLGWTVSGSDLQPPLPVFESLRGRGLRIHRGHAGEYLEQDADVLVYSPAVAPTNPERQRAAQLEIPQFSYNEMLGELMKSRVGISIAGTHGKSTTTAMVASILRDAGHSPSAVIGAELVGQHVSGWAGTSELFVVESCEYQRNFLHLGPTHAVLTGIESDHFDYYHDFRETREAFSEFVSRLPAHGQLVFRGDCEATRVAAASSVARRESFSLRDSSSDWWAADLRPSDAGLRFRLFHRGQFFTEISLQVPGRHNALNALAAAAICHQVGASAEQVREGLQNFRGVRRRFETLGSWRGVTLIDDYAHHPTAVKATLLTAREQFAGRRILCAFQPHQESRTRALLDDFAASFDAADELLLVPIFTARENCREAAERTNAELAARIAARGGNVSVLASLDHLVTTLDDATRPGDVLITMGAGDISQVPHELTRPISRHHSDR